MAASKHATNLNSVRARSKSIRRVKSLATELHLELVKDDRPRVRKTIDHSPGDPCRPVTAYALEEDNHHGTAQLLAHAGPPQIPIGLPCRGRKLGSLAINPDRNTPKHNCQVALASWTALYALA